MSTVYRATAEQLPFLHQLVDPEFKPKNKKMFQFFKKPFFLLNAYMKGTKIDAVLQKDLAFVLENSINLINSVIEVSL